MAVKGNGSTGYLTGSFNYLGGTIGASQAFTIAFWFKPTNLTQTNKYIAQAIGGGSQTAFIWEYQSNAVNTYGWASSGYGYPTSSAITLSDTNWHHIAYRRGDGGGTLWEKILDGSKTTILSSSSFTATAHTESWFLAAQGPAAYIDASLAEFCIWRRALSDDEINALVKGVNPNLLSSANQQSYFPFRTTSDLVNRWSGNTLSLSGTVTTVEHIKTFIDFPQYVNYPTLSGTFAGPDTPYTETTLLNKTLTLEVTGATWIT